MYIPLSSKLSLHKNKKKRLDKPKRSVFDGDEEDHAPKITKLNEKIPDQYVLAARGYTGKEVADANTALKTLHCESEISREDSGAAGSGITFFRTNEELAACAKNERMYLKGMLKKAK
jgi:hypothetical protein